MVSTGRNCERKSQQDISQCLTILTQFSIISSSLVIYLHDRIIIFRPLELLKKRSLYGKWVNGHPSFQKLATIAKLCVSVSNCISLFCGDLCLFVFSLVKYFFILNVVRFDIRTDKRIRI